MSYYFGEQRRQAPRISISLPVTLTDEKNLVHIGQTNDLSNRGLGIILNSPIEERAEFKALIALPPRMNEAAITLNCYVFIIFCNSHPNELGHWRAGGYYSRLHESERKLLDLFLQTQPLPAA